MNWTDSEVGSAVVSSVLAAVVVVPLALWMEANVYVALVGAGVPIAGYVLKAALRVEYPGLWLGVLLAVLGFVAVAVTEYTTPGIGAVLVGWWLFFDSIYEANYGDESSEDDSDSTPLARAGDARIVVGVLREASSPLSRRQVQERTGISEDELEATLVLTCANGTVERIGSGYTVSGGRLEGECGIRRLVTESIHAIAGRLFRPFRLLRPTR